MRLFVKNTEINLSKRDYVSSGGEGHIYVKNNTAYKIYQKQSHVISVDKIKELSVLSLSNIIKPIDPLLNDKKQNVGYTMSFIKNTVSLCQLFPKAFKDRNNISVKEILKLIRQFQEGIQHCHRNNILIVDINEFNFLINLDKFDKFYFIDVDSYQTKSFPATALMDSVRDRHTSINTFSKETDWFSFGIVSFQMFTGIHPYKGKHSIYKTLDDRMQNNVSVFNKDVRIPQTTLSFDIIPDNFRNWYKALFDGGKRMLPPFDDKEIVILPIKQIKIVDNPNNNFTYVLLKTLPSEIILYLKDNIFLTKSGLVYKNKLYSEIAPYSHIIKWSNYLYTTIIKDHRLSLYNIDLNKKIESNFYIENLFSYDNRIYVEIENSIGEVQIFQHNNNTSISVHPVCNILNNATKIYNGCIIQNLLGSYFVSVFPNEKTHFQLNIKELVGYRIIDAKYDKNILIIIAEQKGNYDGFIIKLDKTFTKYKVRLEKNISYSGINFTVLDSGIVSFNNFNQESELFFNDFDKDDIKLIKDNTFDSGKLFNEDNKVLLAKNENLYHIKLK